MYSLPHSGQRASVRPGVQAIVRRQISVQTIGRDAGRINPTNCGSIRSQLLEPLNGAYRANANAVASSETYGKAANTSAEKITRLLCGCTAAPFACVGQWVSVSAGFWAGAVSSTFTRITRRWSASVTVNFAPLCSNVSPAVGT